MKEQPTRYYHFCARCPNVRVAKMKRKTNLCGDCSRKWRDKKMDKYEFDLEAMIIKCIPRVRYFRICPECPPESNTKQVGRKALSGIKLCKFCNGKKSGNANKGTTHEFKNRNRIAPPKIRKRKAGMSEGAIAILRMENEEHRKAQEEKEALPQLSEVDSRAMQEYYLRYK